MKLQKKHAKRWIHTGAAALLLSSFLAGCGDSSDNTASEQPSPATDKQQEAVGTAKNTTAGWGAVDEQPSTVYYELFVRSFADSNDDGIGDLNGVTAKLDYLASLGVGGIWLMPITESPSYHGYDTTDYKKVEPDYGTLDDLKRLVDEAHKRGIKVIMDLVVNHTSSEHPWFKEALTNPSSPYRSWYHFAAADEKVQTDSAAGADSAWHGSGDNRYLSIFWGGMPDLNFDNPKVREAMIDAGQFWLDQGIDGFRLDAAKHIYGDYASTIHTKEVQDLNQAWWQEFRAGLIQKKPDVYLVGEVWDSTSVIAPLLNHALDSGFNFDLAAKLLSGADREQDSDIAFSLSRAYGAYEHASAGAFVDAPFLSNHDQTRVMTALNGNVEHARMAAAMLLTMPGNPFIYYGEELGLTGSKPDERLREPMPWTASLNDSDDTRWIEPMFAKGGDVSVEREEADSGSLLQWYKTLIQWRNEEKALHDGGIDSFKLGDEKGLSAYIRMTVDERVLVVHNLSSKPLQAVISDQTAYGAFSTIVHTTDSSAALEKHSLSLPPYSTVIIK
ncbi:DUF3459 domain-containing protein [Paenibacillus sp. PR3]|uniref:Alpha-amylase n=1 Tax=Paenibacillus terricola TaxID=2763503 RepID=A0ABR8MQ55_9BACL|nr:alpha-amylase family glycosyl hydrolase [Paenibacillus terricola]MBD3918122.1 DUF3459 domain-containing protein [Paenibacillus terricola]